MMLPSVTLTGDQLSDLFFNSDLPEYDNLVDDGDAEQASEALKASAVQFCRTVGIDPETYADALVKDFLSRV